jgi:ketosteroid isomerase-like protein
MHNQPQQQDSELYVKELFRCIDDQDWSGLSKFLHEDAIYERPGYEPFVGKPAIMQFNLSERIIASGQHVVERALSNGQNIACWGSFSGTDKNGRALEARFADVYRLKDGRIDLRQTFFDSPAI